MLETSVNALSLNPSENFQSEWLPWKASYGAVSLWYLELNSTSNKFDIIEYAVGPTTPKGIIDIFEGIKRCYHPVPLDEEWYARHIALCTTEGKLDQDKFYGISDRTNHVSIAGFVYAKKKSFNSRRIHRSEFFDDEYLENLKRKSRIPKRHKKWLNFQTYAALPVFSCIDTGDKPRGVIIAFKNSPQPFVLDDSNIITMTSRLMGILCTRASE
jgi:hypothetical protein